jgi:RimJ/RimL family protein N-acetyltransferase
MLRSFTQSDFPLLSKWVSSEALLHQFSATTFPYPLNYSDIETYLATNTDRKFYMAHKKQYGDFGFGEIIPQQNNVPRLGRLLIGKPELRGKGLGKELILALLDECRSKHLSTAAELYVLTDNLPAIKCYQALGFNFIGNDIELDLCGTINHMKKMRLEF